MNRRHFLFTAVASLLSGAAGFLAGRARGAPLVYAGPWEPKPTPPTPAERELERLRAEVRKLSQLLREESRKRMAAVSERADLARENERRHMLEAAEVRRMAWLGRMPRAE